MAQLQDKVAIVTGASKASARPFPLPLPRRERPSS